VRSPWQSRGPRRGATLQPALHVELMLEDGDPIPEPSPVDAPLPDWLEGMGEVALRTLIRVDLPGRPVRVLRHRPFLVRWKLTRAS
jgi:hypothetical protein